MSVPASSVGGRRVVSHRYLLLQRHLDTFCSRDTFCVSHMMGFNFLSLRTFRCYNPSTGCGVIPALSFRPLSWSERTGQSTTQPRVLRWSYRVFQSLKTGRTATELDCVLVEAGPTSWGSNSTARRGGVYPCQPLGLLECWQRQWPELRSSVEGDGTVSHLHLRGQTLPVSLPLTSETGCYCSSFGQLHGERRNCMNETCC